MCVNKIKYATLAKAKKVAAIVAKKNKMVTFMSGYRCLNCGGFHVGKSKSINWNKVY